jgi:hypothetical protein
MPNTMSGRGQLRTLSSAQGGFEVDFEIHFGTEIVRQARGGLPPVPRTTLTVTKMQTTDGRPIPEGQYVLHAQTEIRLAKGFNGNWYLI